MSSTEPPENAPPEQTPASPDDPTRLNLLFDVLLNVARGNDEAQLLREFASQLSAVLDFERCWFGFLEHDGTLSFRSSTNSDASAEISPSEREMLGETIRAGTNRRVEQTDPAATLVCLPLTVADKTRGAVLLVSSRQCAFSRDDIRFANAATTVLAVALDRLRRIAALGRSNEELEFAYVAVKGDGEAEFSKSAIVREAENELPGIASFDDALDAWAQQARNLIGSHQSAVSYFPDGNIAEGRHAISLSDKNEKYQTYDVLPSGEGIWSVVIREKLSFCLTDEELKSHPAWKNFSDLRDERGLEHPPMRGWLAVPVLSREQEFVGLLQLTDKYEGDYTQRDLRRLTRLAQLMAPSFSLQYAIEQLQRRNDELTNAKDALEQSNVELQQFAYIASHDLQTPLRGIAGFSQFLQRDYQGKFDDKADDYINRIVESAKRMQQLINDLLAYSRVESRSAPFAAVDLNEVVDDAVILLGASIQDAGGEVKRGELPTVVGDRSQLSQLLQNLIGNAVKYHGDELPQVDMSAENDGTLWTIAVRDNGIGIATRHHKQIFEIFRRLHSADKYPGTGIGLAVCRRIAERHGGNIWLASIPGKGTTFYVSIPMRESERT